MTGRPLEIPQHRFQLRSVAFFGRTLAEYLQMLALDLGELQGKSILDVASGPGNADAGSLQTKQDRGETHCPRFARAFLAAALSDSLSLPSPSESNFSRSLWRRSGSGPPRPP